MWIWLYPIENRTLVLKILKRVVFLVKPKPQHHLSQWGECVCGAQSLKQRRLLCKSEFIQLKNEFKYKNGKKRSFSYETKALTSSIPMRRIRLWCQIMKRKEIILWIRVCQNRPMNINSENGGKRCFYNETKASIPFILTRKMNLWHPIINKKEIITWIRVYPIEIWNLILKILKRVVFLMKPKHQ